jgi:hypothetical protein
MAYASHVFDIDDNTYRSENITTSWELFTTSFADDFLTDASDFTGNDDETEVTYTGTATKKFLVSWQASMSANSVSRLLTAQIRVDGTAAADTTVGAWLDEANREKSFCGSHVVEVAQNETIGVYFYCSSSTTIVMQRFQMTCVEVE